MQITTKFDIGDIVSPVHSNLNASNIPDNYITAQHLVYQILEIHVDVKPSSDISYTCRAIMLFKRIGPYEHSKGCDKKMVTSIEEGYGAPIVKMNEIELQTIHPKAKELLDMKVNE